MSNPKGFINITADKKGFIIESDEPIEFEKKSNPEYWGKAGAGVLPYCIGTRRYLLALRSEHVNEPHTWGVWGGKIDHGETPEQAACREVGEELGEGCVPECLHILHVYRDGGFTYTTFLLPLGEEFMPDSLNWETDEAKWFTLRELMLLPNLHFGVKALLPALKRQPNPILDLEGTDPRPDSKYDQDQLRMGLQVEREHTSNPRLAKVIVKDHLDEIPDYYTHLQQMESGVFQPAFAPNPLKRDSSDASRRYNIRQEIHAGKPIKQAVAIGYSLQRQAAARGNPHTIEGKRLIKEAINAQAKQYGEGLTDDWRNAGIIFPDGTLLKMGRDTREEDHRIVANLIVSPDPTRTGDRWYRLVEFLVKTRSIRFMPEVPAFDVFVAPTRQQLRTIKHVLEDVAHHQEQTSDEILIDIHSPEGERLHSAAFHIDDWHSALEYLGSVR